MGKYLLSLILVFLSFSAWGQYSPLSSADSIYQWQWVENTYDQMSLEEKVGQLFMVMTSTENGDKAQEKISSYIQEHSLGGIIFSRGGPRRQAKVTNAYQNLPKFHYLWEWMPNGDWPCD